MITLQITFPFLWSIPKTGVLSIKLLPWEFFTFLSQWRFLFFPPTNVSSISTFPFSFPLFLHIKQVLIFCNIYQAVFWVTCISLDSCKDEIPFLWEVTNHIAINHFLIGTLVPWKIVPILTWNIFWVFLHIYLWFPKW